MARLCRGAPPGKLRTGPQTHLNQYVMAGAHCNFFPPHILGCRPRSYKQSKGSKCRHGFDRRAPRVCCCYSQRLRRSQEHGKSILRRRRMLLRRTDRRARLGTQFQRTRKPNRRVLRTPRNRVVIRNKNKRKTCPKRRRKIRIPREPARRSGCCGSSQISPLSVRAKSFIP